MTGIYDDGMIPSLTDLTDAVHQARGRVAARINHAGIQCSAETVSETIAPLAMAAAVLQQPA